METNVHRPLLESQLFRKLSNSDATFLEYGFSLEEVRAAVWDLISKLLASRLAKVIDSIIGPNQSAYIKGRQILDGCLVANEIIRRAKLEDQRLLLFKVDFEKAFDSVNWNFLLDIMRQMSFLWNMALGKETPLSPFLFLIVAEALQVTILNACDKGIFKGLKVNLDKSRIFGVGVPVNEVISVASSLGCAHGALPFTYLGVLVGGQMRLSGGWQGIIDRFRDRLSSWKAKSLGERSSGQQDLDWRVGLAYSSYGRAQDDLVALSSLLNAAVFSNNGCNKWYWSYDASGCFKASLYRLATRPNLIAQGVALPSSNFPLCDSEVEDIRHILVKCPNIEHGEGRIGVFTERSCLGLRCLRLWAKRLTMLGCIIPHSIRADNCPPMYQGRKLQLE
ncbi:putative RNA-directed DNA polymerase, eukaryota, reverse transcriptase zinc-binding domain protein [Tanacetum coccineum]|uniref:RNA-directed DNA polymerase, eukaryota, reverse transcriptase zinc-binding domain protein n=1 Tax=Tanacetum coccineum TaxID=301880 RepID=A0ABQ4XR40_9ASTR